MHMLLRLLLLLALLPLGVSASASPGPSLFVPGAAPPGPPAYTSQAAPPGPRLSQTVEVCSSALADPAVSQPAASSPWLELRQVRTIVSDPLASTNKVIRLSQGAGGAASVGQQFAVPAATAEITGTLAYRYALGTAQAGDKLQVEIYEVGKLSAPVFALDIATQADDSWHTATWGLTDPATLSTLSGLGRATFLATLRNAAGGLQRGLWVDNIGMGVCVSSATISGNVTQGGTAVVNAQVLLLRTTLAGSALIASATTDVSGAYNFFGVPPLGAGDSYRVWYLNVPTGVSRPDGLVGFWAGPAISALAAGQTLTGQHMLVGDVPLSSPASYSTVVATDGSPATLRWAARGVAGETYQLCVYDPRRIDPATQLPAQVCGARSGATTFALSPRSFSGVSSFGFQYGRSYRWYVIAYGPGAQYGYSFYERAITLLGAPASPPIATVTPSPALPAADGSVADWTVMVYAAGDNVLGDKASTAVTSQLSRQLDQLRSMAGNFPRLHLVTLSDTYGDTGAQLCYLPPTAPPDCQERGEISTGDPATLGDFISTAMARYPANHTMLILAGPGHPIGGFGTDLTAAGTPALGIDGLRSAFGAAGLGVGGKKLDLLFYQASLMGAVEVVAASAPYARYMVAASDEYWSLPLYTSILPLLVGAKKDAPAEVAKGIVGAYSATVDIYGRGKARSLAAYDLGQAAAVSAALNNLGSALQSSLAGDSAGVRAILGRVHQSAQSYDSSGNGLLDALEQQAGDPISVDDDVLVDLKGMAGAINAETVDTLPALQDASNMLLTALGGAKPLVLASVQASGIGIADRPVALTNAQGLSVFFPTGVRLGDQPAMVQRYLYGASGAPRDGSWAGFLRVYLASELGRGPGGVTAGPLGGAQIRGASGVLSDLFTWMPFVSR